MAINGFKIFKALPSFLAVLFVFIGASSAAQEGNKEGDRMKAREHIMMLRDGALLVRLQTRSQSIQTLKDRGMEDRARQLEIRQRKQNQEYVEAFISEFDFAPVYFFKSQDSELVRDGNLSKVILLNGEMKPDSTIKLEESAVYLSEFGRIAPDDSKIRAGYRLEKDSMGVNQKATYYGSTNMGFEALVIMDDQFVQLRKPFPYYVRTFGKGGLITRSPKKTVKRMNEKLFQFYSLARGGEQR